MKGSGSGLVALMVQSCASTVQYRALVPGEKRKKMFRGYKNTNASISVPFKDLLYIIE